MARGSLHRTPSRNGLSSTMPSEEAFSPRGDLRCICGAGQQLESERMRLASSSRCLGDRAELLVGRETEVMERVQVLDEETQALQQLVAALHDKRAKMATSRARFEERSKQLEARELNLRNMEGELQEQATLLEELQTETIAKEEAVAKDELELMEQRNKVEAALESIGQKRTELDDKEASLVQQRGNIEREFHDATKERELLEGDRELLTEIEVQVGIVRRNLSEQERALAAEELDLQAQEDDYEETAAKLVPERQHAADSLAVAEERLRELRAREEQSQHQLSRLKRRQRDLGGEEVRLNGLEAALRLHGNDTGKTGKPGSFDNSDTPVDEMQLRLQRLKQEGSHWSERFRHQQEEVASLEERVLELEEDLQFCPSPARNGCGGSGFMLKHIRGDPLRLAMDNSANLKAAKGKFV